MSRLETRPTPDGPGRNDAQELFTLMLREYNDALGNGCDGDGAYDCMLDAGAEFLRKLDILASARTYTPPPDQE